MRLSELLGAEVVDESGRRAGVVHDVRLVQDAPTTASLQAGLRLDGLVVGRRVPGTRLGYDRAKVRGPLPLKLLFGRLRRRRYVAWERVRLIEPGRIQISGWAEDLPRAQALP